MKKMILTVVAGLTMAATTSQACEGGLYKGSLEAARLLQNTENVVCNYNGEQDDNYQVDIRVPRCLNARPEVTLSVLGDELQVQNIKLKTIRGIYKYTTKFIVETLETDHPVVCQELARPRN